MGQPAPMGDVRSLAADVLAQVAPGELPQLNAALAELARDPDHIPKFHDEELGFGEVLFAVSDAPMTVWLVQQALGFATGLVLETATKPVWSRLVKLLRRIPLPRRFRRPRPLATRPSRPLTGAELAQVKAATLDRATAAGVSAETAELLADAIVGSLAIQP